MYRINCLFKRVMLPIIWYKFKWLEEWNKVEEKKEEDKK